MKLKVLFVKNNTKDSKAKKLNYFNYFFDFLVHIQIISDD